MTIVTTTIPTDLSTELAECGWRYETIVLADGTTTEVMVPLTEEEFLHPQEDYRLPNSTFHDQASLDAKDITARRYADRSDVGVFHDLLIEWDIPDLKVHSPDVCVAFGIRNKEQNRTKFIVSNEGVRPAFVLEVVSPRYRKADREIKVLHYATARVQEYVIVDRRPYREQMIDEVLGYRLTPLGTYQPISPDDDGRIYCQTLDLWISLQDGRLVIQDGQTGERLLRSDELETLTVQERLRAEQAEHQAEQERLRAEQAEHQAEQERLRAEQAEYQAEQERLRSQRLADLLRAQGIDPDQY
ncbi:MAG: Uma2 family endonuclease [Cyanobacteria bacterium]|nr:Uma2 family endonuclease [Cyanobacteriota bacterium]MDW8199594.1 Uma2 family endonuclease [Cyanobacteriota bacterium SKYGB_h_bin112]